MPTPSPVDDSSSSSSSVTSSCFASTESVTLESGETRMLSQVQLGDKVLTASLNGAVEGVFSPVIAVPHANERQVLTTFVQLVTASKDIKVKLYPYLYTTRSF